MFSNNDTKIRYELSLNCETKYNEFYQLNLDKHIEKNIVERIRLLDSTIFSERNYSEFLRATRQKRIGVEVSSSAEKRIRREEPELNMNLLSEKELSELNTTISASLKNLYSLLDGNQFRIIESDDDLFDDKDTFEMMTKTFMKKPHIAQLSTKDHTNANMRNDLPQQQNSERDIDMFIKRHIFSCFDTILDSHFSIKASRNRRAEAINASSNTEGYHLDWMSRYGTFLKVFNVNY
ncbi:4799_t:CDS:2 [Rhizophagus irregularis]|nr:4799_t:CDS:2 [Rhizophagus irregularis]